LIESRRFGSERSDLSTSQVEHVVVIAGQAVEHAEDVFGSRNHIVSTLLPSLRQGPFRGSQSIHDGTRVRDRTLAEGFAPSV
jgi:hypothetical protein